MSAAPSDGAVPPGPPGRGPPAGARPWPGSGGAPTFAGPPPMRQAPLDWATLRSFWPYLRGARRELAILVPILVVTSTLPILITLAPAVLGKSVSAPGPTSGAAPSGRPGDVTAMFAIALVILPFFPLRFVLVARVAQEVALRLREALFQKLGRSTGAALAATSIGERAVRNTEDIERVQNFFSRQVPDAAGLVVQSCLLVLALGWLWVYSDIPGLSVGAVAIGLAVLAAPVVIASRMHRRLREMARARQETSERVLTRFIEGIGGSRDLIAAGRFGEAASRYSALLGELRTVSVRSALWGGIAGFLPAVGFMVVIMAYFVVVGGEIGRTGGSAKEMALAMGAVSSFTLLLLSLQRLPMEIGFIRTEVALVAPSFRAIRAALDEPETSSGTPGVKPRDNGIVLRDVIHRYGGDGRPVLDRLNLDIPDGSFAAIVGQSGCGKSTVLHVLLRFFEPASGEVLVGGVPLRDVPLDELRALVGFIPQAPFMFDATLRENIVFGVPEEMVPEERLREVVRMARLEELVERRASQGGLDARLGPGGISLSGGERQRIALARVLIRDPRILLCDEYTANVDNATARLIQDALAKQFAGRTRVVVSHQLYAIRGADVIFVMDRGRIVDRGTHEELVARPGLFRDLWEVQRVD